MYVPQSADVRSEPGCLRIGAGDVCNQFPEATFGNSVIVSIGRGPRKPGSFYGYF